MCWRNDLLEVIDSKRKNIPLFSFTKFILDIKRKEQKNGEFNYQKLACEMINQINGIKLLFNK